MMAAVDAALDDVRRACEAELARERERHAVEVEAVRRENDAIVDRLVDENRRLVDERNALLAQLSHARPAGHRAAGTSSSSSSASVSSTTSSSLPRPPRNGGPSRRPEAHEAYPDDYGYTREESAAAYARSPRSRAKSAPSANGRARAARYPAPDLIYLDAESTNHHAELLAEIDERLSAKQASFTHLHQATVPAAGGPLSPLSMSYSSATSLGLESGVRAAHKPSSPPRSPRSPRPAADAEELSRRGRDFFAKARALLTEQQFAQLLTSMKELNRGNVRREDVVATASVLLQDAAAPELVETFELLLQGQIPA